MILNLTQAMGYIEFEWAERDKVYQWVVTDKDSTEHRPATADEIHFLEIAAKALGV